MEADSAYALSRVIKPAVVGEPPEAGDVRPRLDQPLGAPASPARIFDRFLAVCRERPEATAIVFPGGSWTYEELEDASRALAIQLIANHSDGDVVALYSHRSGELVVAMLACLRAGLTFLVLDAGYPVERLQQLVATARPSRLIAIGATSGDEDVIAVVGAQIPSALIRLDAAAMTDLLRSDVRDHVRLDTVSRDAIGYLLFTSGTTGVPKCIETSHAPLVHFIKWYEQAFAVDETCRFSMLSGLGHDPILRDIFVPLSVGAQLHVPAQAAVLDPLKLSAWLADSRVTHAHVTPQLCRIISGGRGERGQLATLRFLFSGGDMLRRQHVNELAGIAPGARVVNFYGTTETPQAMAHHVFDPEIDGTCDVIPIGRGIDDVQLVVVDSQLELAAIGARGQIAIRTRFLSAGYRGDAALTSKKFVANPRALDPADQLYLTGDVGYFRPDGTVVAEGRVDDQVKVRGFRVELGDVVHQLERIAAVEQAVVLPEPMPDGETRLVAYLIARSAVTDTATATAAVRAAMTDSSPAYMVPSRYVWMEHFPLLPNGKLDRETLTTREPADDVPLPVDPIEAELVRQWQSLLGLTRIDVNSSFTDLGGDSLSFIVVGVQVEELLGALPASWEKLSIRELARAKQAKRSSWTRVESTVLLRAISIVAVAVGHFELGNLAGSVFTLFVVSGMSFGKYLVPSVVRTDRVTPIARLVLKIAVPTILYTLLIDTLYKRITWSSALLLGNFVSHDARQESFTFWFIDVLVQNLLLLAAILAVGPVRRSVAKHPFTHALVATVLLAGVAALAPFIWNTYALDDYVPHMYLGSMCLGWAAVAADSPRQRLLVMAAMVLTFALPAWRSHHVLVLPFAATVFLVYQRQVSLPRYAGRLINVLAGASLYIYLTDNQVLAILARVGLGEGSVIGVGVALVVGVGARRLWELASIGVRRCTSSESLRVVVAGNSGSQLDEQRAK